MSRQIAKIYFDVPAQLDGQLRVVVQPNKAAIELKAAPL